VILTVCLNIAIDTTYTVPGLVPGSSHRVATVGARAGGKGVNVARVLTSLGKDVVLTGLAGGSTGAQVAADLAGLTGLAGLTAELVPIAGESRRTMAVVHGAEVTVFNEAGPLVTAEEWRAFLESYAGLVAAAGVVVLSGSVPPGIPASAYAELTGTAHTAGAAVIIDAEGELLHEALAQGPEIAKPNANEVATLLGRPARTTDDATEAAELLVKHGAKTAIVSQGAEGFVAVTPGKSYAVRPGRLVHGNPTGAGDALAAALADGLTKGQDWPELLRNAAAVAAAAVAAPLAGDFDARLAAELRNTIQVEEV
jgi:tagatose 6-phosphate kinase